MEIASEPDFRGRRESTWYILEVAVTEQSSEFP